MSNVRHFVGLDLGQATEFTSLAIVERPLVHPTDPPQKKRPPYALRHLERFPLGTSYPVIVETVRERLRSRTLTDMSLVIDQTGVGKAVLDVLIEGLQGHITCPYFQVTLTAGHDVTVSEGLHVPKKELVSSLQVLLQTRRLRIPRGLEAASLLVEELQNYRMRVSTARNESVELWREGTHDDLILAVALATWMGELTLPPFHPPEEETPAIRVVVV